MAFAPRARATIRDSILTDWSARYAAIGKTLLTVKGSDAYMFADTLALELEALEAQAAALTAEILPDTADTTFLNRHGDVEGLSRQQAAAAVLPVTASGAASSTINLTGQTLNAPGGLKFTPCDASGNAIISFLTGGGGTASIYAKCTTAGATGNLPSATVLTWSSTPTLASATATVNGSPSSPGTDPESDGSYAARILLRRQERPASGNRADWQAWAQSVTGVTDAYVYPLYDATLGPGTIGAVTVTILGPPQGSSAVNTRIVGATIVNNVKGYIEGTCDVAGNPLPTALQKQLRPVAIKSGAYSIEAAFASPQAITVQIKTSSGYPIPWTGTLGPTTYATTQKVGVDGDFSSFGLIPMLVPVATSKQRGGYTYVLKPTAVDYNTTAAGKTVWTFAAGTIPGDGFPENGRTIYPAPANTPQILAAIFDYFDGLGPGDTTNPNSLRWPTEDVQGRSTLYRTALAAAVIDGSPGVLSATVTSPGADVTPGAKALITLDIVTPNWL